MPPNGDADYDPGWQGGPSPQSKVAVGLAVVLLAMLILEEFGLFRFLGALKLARNLIEHAADVFPKVGNRAENYNGDQGGQ